MADESRKRLSVTLTDADNPRRTFTAPLKRFTPETLEQYQDDDQDVAESIARALAPYQDETNAPEDLEERFAYIRAARKVAARERVVGTFRLVRSIIDIDAVKVDAHREWIESEPDGDVWATIGQDLEECERALQSFRRLLGVSK